ncbi:germinal-center associated nuclear protein-like [Lycorma delicatula]|uniref:germinal-center associated nuclear protein-like n=1 Tax=Lycorma delicatula TaxID=130591 RepID=UPI003F5177B0
MKMESDEEHFYFGTCDTMCPIREAKMRLRNGLMHILETKRRNGKKNKIKISENWFNLQLFVKCCQISTANSIDLCVEKYLRCPETLLKTVNYLLTKVILDDRVPWNEVADFLCDRLRSVRQDLVVQDVPGPDCLEILEPIVRYHVYAAYRLSGASLSEFDLKSNNDHLTICLDQVFGLYYKTKIREYCVNRPEMEALYQIINFGKTDAIVRGLTFLQKYQSDDLKIATEMSLAWYRRDYFTILKKLKFLNPILQAAIVAFKFPEIRRCVLEIMSVAYSCKNSGYPTEYLAQLLLYNSVSAAEEDCAYYNLQVSKGLVIFWKDSFDLLKEGLKRRENCLSRFLTSESLPQILLSTSQRNV